MRNPPTETVLLRDERRRIEEDITVTDELDYLEEYEDDEVTWEDPARSQT